MREPTSRDSKASCQAATPPRRPTRIRWRTGGSRSPCGAVIIELLGRRLLEYRKPDMRGEGFVTPREYHEGRVARGLGDAARAKSSFERARERAAEAVQRDPGNGKALSILALIEAALQRKGGSDASGATSGGVTARLN